MPTEPEEKYRCQPRFLSSIENWIKAVVRHRELTM